MPTWLKLLRHKWITFCQLPRSTQVLFVETIWWLGLARLVVLWLPFCWIRPYLGPVNQAMTVPDESDRAVQPTNRPPQAETIAQIRWMLHRAGRYTVWDSNCLARSMAGKMMLRRRGITSTLYLGVTKDGDQMKAHAWLLAGRVRVTGVGALHGDNYRVISSFGTETA